MKRSADSRRAKRLATPSPFLIGVHLAQDRASETVHPFTLPVLSDGLDLTIKTPVTLLVGENGTGKSTLIEAIAWAAGFGSRGGGRDHRLDGESDEGRLLGSALRLVWRRKTSEGFFLRAETLFEFATYLEQAGSTFERYGGRSLHAQSHGESFLSLFQHRFREGLFLLDEPEAALSPQRQLAFLRILHDLTEAQVAQFIVATHSPLLLTFPGATVLSLDGERITPVSYEETEHFRLTRDFLSSPERFHRLLFCPDEDDAQV